MIRENIDFVVIADGVLFLCLFDFQYDPWIFAWSYCRNRKRIHRKNPKVFGFLKSWMQIIRS